MSELKFANTKWDARTWTQEQKIKWQEKAFELGYRFGGDVKPIYLSSEFYFLEDDLTITRTGSYDVFQYGEEVLLDLKDMFLQEEVTQEPEVETKQSVFTHPRWVTCATSPLLCSIDITEGRDYKVIDVIYEESKVYQYIICNDKGVVNTYHVSHFHKVTPEDCTYSPSAELVEEECNGFENLVYVDPSVDYINMKYFVLPKESCSEAQWKYCQNNLPLTIGSYGGDLTLQICNDGDGWFDNYSVDEGGYLSKFQ